MAHEKRGKQRVASPKIESYSSSDSEATEEASPIVHHTSKRKVILKVPLRSHGRGWRNLQGPSGQGSCPCIKHASTPGSHMADAGESF
jgi:hypothetical protein